MQSIHYGLCQYVQQRIIDMALVVDNGPPVRELPPAQVYLRRIIDDRDVAYPCVIVCPWVSEGIEDETFGDQNCSFSVLVGSLWANNQDYRLFEQELFWRQQIVDAFDGPPLIPILDPASTLVDDIQALANVIECHIESVDIVNADAWHGFNLAAGSLVLRFDTNRPRTGQL